MRVFLITGYSKSGKDTLYQNIQNNHFNNYVFINKNSEIYEPEFPKTNIKRYAFADDLKRLLIERYSHLANVNIEENKDKITFNGKTIRDNLIELSEDVKKRYGEDYFAQRVLMKIFDEQSPKNIFITDWRFAYEYFLFKTIFQNNLVTIRIIRPGIVPKQNDTLIDNFEVDITIINNN